MQKLSIQTHAAWGMALASLVILVLAGVAWNFSQQTQAAATYVAHTHQVIGAINDLESNLFRAEAGQRAFLATQRPGYRRERDAALQALEKGLNGLAALIADNPAQSARLDSLRRELGLRVALYRQSEALLGGSDFSIEQRIDQGAQALDSTYSLVATMIVDEERLLAEREATERSRSNASTAMFIVLAVVLALSLPVIFWRLYSELAARQRAEAVMKVERHHDELHARALMLYNAENHRDAVLDGTLALLSENPLFPVSAFYAFDEWGGMLHLAASRGAPADIRPLVRLGEGALGLAARDRQPVYLDGFDAATGLRIETALASIAPAAILMCPVLHQGRLLGVLALASRAGLAERDRQFVQRTAAQLAVALHNLGQLDELKLMAEQLRVRGEDIQLKNAELEKASRLKSEFLANMSHELRTPLNAIIGFSEIMKDGLSGELSDEQREYVGDIYSSGRHLLSLINDILDLSKVESGHVPLELAPMQPVELSTSAMSMLRDRASSARVRLTALCPPQLGSLRADVRKAKQIVYNLLSNALKFTPEGGSVSLALSNVGAAEVAAVQPAADTRVFAPSPPEGVQRYLEIRVADSGIGISPDGLQQLFQPFVQIDSSLSRQYAGTGLGLTMVKRLTELHGGGLMVRSAPGEGSTFTVWLPWRENDTPAVLHELPVPVPVTLAPLAVVPAADSAPLVLIVEDDPRAANLMRVQLQAQGYRVEFAHTAEEGLRRAADLHPAALVLDIILPGMDGWDMLSRLKDHDDTRHIPVVIVSIVDEARRGFALGAAQVLVKPVSQEDLLGALAAAGLDGPSPDQRVLVVDDDPKAVSLVSKHLQVAGFTVVAAYGGQEALDLARERPPALIVLDLMMPGVSGFDVVQGLRSSPQTAEIPVIVLTAKLLTQDDRLQLRGRVQQVMEKAEFDATSLLAEVKRSLAKQRPRRA